MKECKLLTKKSRRQCTVGAILYAMQFSIFARSFSLIAAEHPVKVAGITKVPFQSLLTSGHIDPKWRKLKGRHLLGAVF